MRSTIFACLLVLLSVNIAQSQTLTTRQFINKFITLYNDESFEDIVSMFASRYRATQIKNMVIKNLTDIYDNHGEILTNVTMQSSSSMAVIMVTFKDDLSTGVIAVILSKSKVQFGMLAAMPNSSFVDYVSQNSGSIGFEFIFNDAKISKNAGKYFSVEALQVFPVSVEYANQVAQGKLKSTRVVRSSEVKKYLIQNYDGNFYNFDIYRKASQTLGSLVRQNLRSPSLAVCEYLVDLLGLENVKDTIDELGISQDRTMYPASHYVLIAQAAASAKTNVAFYETITDKSNSDITDANEQIHAILKTGNRTATTLLSTTVSQLSKNSTRNGINMLNTIGTAEGYAEAFQAFIDKDYDLDGDTNKIYSTLTSFASSSSSLFGTGTQLMFSASTLDGDMNYRSYGAGGIVIPRKATYKSLAFCFSNSGAVQEDEEFQKNLGLFLLNMLSSPEYRMAAEDAF